MSEQSSNSILKQISQTQDKVNNYLFRVEVLEKNLRKKDITLEERVRLETELTEIKEGILKSQKELKSFYGENRVTMIFAVLLMFFSFLCYGLYVMIVGPKTKI